MMKKIAILLTVLFLLMPFAVEGSQNQQFWFCEQVGIMDNQNTMFISNVFRGPESRQESMFEKVISVITRARFQPSFDGACFEFVNAKKANLRRIKEIKRAKHRKFNLFYINFSTPKSK